MRWRDTQYANKAMHTYMRKKERKRKREVKN